MNFYRLIYRFILTSCLTLSTIGGQAQDYLTQINQYSTDIGLSHREVQCVFQDRDGVIWAGTRFGLNRFDGYSFKIWTSDKYADGVNYISRITQDDKGWLWIWNNEGIIFMNPVTEVILSAKEYLGQPLPFDPSLKTKSSWKFWVTHEIPVDEKGRLYLSNQSSSYFTYHSTEGFKKHKIADVERLEIRGFDSSNNILGFEVYNSGWGENLIIINKAGEKSICEGCIVSLSHRPSEEILNHFITSYLTQTGDYLSISKQLQFYNNVLGHFWVMTKDKLTVYDHDANILLKIPKEKLYVVLDEGFNHIYNDKRGRVWLASHYGLLSVDVKQSKFRKHAYFLNNKEKSFNNSARGIWVEDDHIITNFEKGGLVYISTQPAANDFRQVSKNLDDGLSLNTKFKDNQYLNRPILPADDEHYWIGGRYSLYKYNQKTEKTKRFDFQPNQNLAPPSDLWTLFTDQKEVLWIGTGNGLAYKNPSEGFLRLFKEDENFPEFNRAFILDIRAGSDHQIWLCSDKGLFLVDTEKQKIISSYGKNADADNYLPTSSFQHLHQASDGVYWIATRDGLLRWDFSKKEYRLFTSHDGLPCNNIYAVYSDKQGKLWLSSDQGIISFDKNNYDINVFLPEDGVTHHEFNRISHFQNTDGRIYFGSMNGITSFHPDDFKSKKPIDTQGSMIISNFQIFNKDRAAWEDQTGMIRANRSITMAPNNPYFSLKVALLDYGSTKTINYSYRIKGLSDDWFTQKEQTIELNRMPYGNYKLEIIGQSTGASKTKAHIDFGIIVERPIYLHFWFIASVCISLLVGLFSFFKLRTLRLKQRQKELEKQIDTATKLIQKDKILIEDQVNKLSELIQFKDNIFAILGHDLRKPALAFRGVTQKINYLLEKQDYKRLNALGQSIENDANALSHLTNNLLNWVLVQKNGLSYHPKPLPLLAIVNEIESLFRGIIKDKKVHLTIDIPTTLKVYADYATFCIILRNLIDNAVKFTPSGGVITIKAIIAPDCIQISITDTGIGIAANDLQNLFSLDKEKSKKGTDGERGTGLGLYLVHQLATLNKGTLEVKSEIEQGTAFVLSLPLD